MSARRCREKEEKEENVAASRWTEVTVETDPHWIDLVSAALIALGANGVAISGLDPAEAAGDWADRPEPDASAIRAYFPVDDLLGERLNLLRARLDEAAKDLAPIPARISLHAVAESDWAEAWKPYFHPVHVDRVAVIPSWEDYTPAPGEAVVRMDPGLAFGAGTHPTTQQSLSLLQQVLAPGDCVLDLGTGSGILAIAAARLGAGPVLARDVDPSAIKVALENVAANGLTGVIRVEQGDLLAGMTGRFDMILANLIAPLLLDLLPSLPPFLAPGAKAILAGIIADRAAEVKAAAIKAGLTVAGEIAEGEWVALLVRR